MFENAYPQTELLPMRLLKPLPPGNLEFFPYLAEKSGKVILKLT